MAAGRLTVVLLALALWRGDGREVWAALAVWIAWRDTDEGLSAERPLTPVAIALAVTLAYNAWRPGPPVARPVAIGVIAAVTVIGASDSRPRVAGRWFIHARAWPMGTHPAEVVPVACSSTPASSDRKPAEQPNMIKHEPLEHWLARAHRPARRTTVVDVRAQIHAPRTATRERRRATRTGTAQLLRYVRNQDIERHDVVREDDVSNADVHRVHRRARAVRRPPPIPPSPRYRPCNSPWTPSARPGPSRASVPTPALPSRCGLRDRRRTTRHDAPRAKAPAVRAERSSCSGFVRGLAVFDRRRTDVLRIAFSGAVRQASECSGPVG